MRPRYFHQVVGVNSRLDAIQASVLCAKIKHLSDYSNDRAHNAERYQKLLNRYGIGQMVSAPQSSNGCEHVWNQYTIRIPNGQRDEVRKQLADVDVGSEIYYPVPVHQQECFEFLATDSSTMVETEKAALEVLSLPIFPELTQAEQDYVVSSLANCLLAGTQQDTFRRVA